MEDGNTTLVGDTSSSSQIQFILLLVVEIPAAICAVLILFCLFRHWHTMIRKALRNHTILLLTSISFLYITLDLPFTISSLHLGYDSPSSPSFCRYWYWIDYFLIVSSLFLTATASVQRHILIFNAACLRRMRVRLLFHYTPLMFCLLYPAIFYLLVIYFYPCENSPDENSSYCQAPCYSSNTLLYNIDWTINTIFPIFVMIVANIVLIFRVTRSLRNLHRRQSLMLTRERKLAIDLLTIVSLYTVGWVPSTIVGVLQQFFWSDLLETIPAFSYFYYLSYFVCPLQPFVCLITSPEIMQCIKSDVRRVLGRAIVLPEVIVRRGY